MNGAIRYDLNTLYKNNYYDDLLEIYDNPFNKTLTESIASIPMDKVKSMIQKISTIKTEEDAKNLVSMNKKFVKDAKELNDGLDKLAKKLNYSAAEVAQVRTSVSKSLGLIFVSVNLIGYLLIPVMIAILITSAVKKKSLTEVTKQVSKEISESVKEGRTGKYSNSIEYTIRGIITYLAGGMLLIIFTPVGLGIIGLPLMIYGAVLMIAGLISFLAVLITTPGRA